MQVSVTDAQDQLPELVRRAGVGEDVILTQPGKPSVRLVVTQSAPTLDERWALLEALRGSAKHSFGPDAAHCADWLYDDYGLPA